MRRATGASEPMGPLLDRYFQSHGRFASAAHLPRTGYAPSQVGPPKLGLLLVWSPPKWVNLG